MTIKIFKDIQDSPAYLCAEYKKVIGDWDYLHDLFEGIKNWSTLDSGKLIPTERANFFLPRHPQETTEEYYHRFQMTDFDDAFASALRGFVDLMFADGIELEAPDYFLDHWKKLSDNKISGNAFLPEIALSSLILGVTYVFIDYSSSRPYWALIDPRTVPNWSLISVDGLITLGHITIKSESYELINGIEEKITRYRVYRYGGGWVEYDYKEVKEGYQFEFLASGILTVNDEPVMEIPLVPIHVSPYRPNYMIGDRLFRSLADKNKALYQITSDYRRKMSLCSTSQPVRYDPMGEGGDLILSPSRIVDLRSPDAFFKWEEPATASLGASRQEIQDLEKSIAYQSSTFMKTPLTNISPEGSALTIQPLQSGIQTMVISFVEGIQKCIQLHQNYLGDHSEIKITISPTLIDPPSQDSQSVLALQASFKNGMITRYSSVKILGELGFIKPEILQYELSQPEVILPQSQV